MSAPCCAPRTPSARRSASSSAPAGTRAPAASPTPPTRRSMCRCGASRTSRRWHLPQRCVLVGVELLDDAIDLPSFRHPLNAAYVLGPERSGLSPAMLQRCRHVVRIPTRFALNLAVAGALVLYDRLLQHGRFAERPVGSRGAAACPAGAAPGTGRRAFAATSRTGWRAEPRPSHDAARACRVRSRAVSLPACVSTRGFARCSSLPLSGRPRRRSRSRAARKADGRRRSEGNSASSMTGSRRRIRSPARPSAMRSSARKNSAPALPGRGEVVLTVTERPSGRDTVAISAGFPFAQGRGGDRAGRSDRPRLLHRPEQRVRPRRQGRGGRVPEGQQALARSPGPRDGQIVVDTSACAALPRPMRRSTRPVRHADERHRLRPDRGRARRASSPSRRCSIRRRCSSPDGRRDLVGLSRAELAAEMAAIGEAPFRAKQLWHWIYHQGVTDFARMSSIARPLQQKLAERFVIGRPEAVTVQTSDDETRKFLFRFRDGQEAETVYIPDREEDRGAVCISSQVGCTLSCRFCHTGTQTSGAQPRRAGDRRPVHGGARRVRRMAEPEGRDAAAAVHHRADGHGRAAVQLRQRRQGDDDRHGRRGHRPVAAADHAVHLGRGADDGPLPAPNSA